MLKKLSVLFGVLFLTIGVLGFVPGITTDEGLLLGIFKVDALHNIIHILSGAAALYAGSKSEDYAQLYFRVFGAVYAVVALIGIVQSDTVLGLIDINSADNVLHIVLAVAILGIGFGVPKSQTPAKSA